MPELNVTVSNAVEPKHNFGRKISKFPSNRVHKGRYAKVNKIIPKSLELILPSSLSVF